MPFAIGALVSAIGVWITRYLVFLAAKLTIRLLISAFVWAIYIAFFLFAVDVINDVYDAFNNMISKLETSSSSSSFKVASASGILSALIDVLKIDVGFIFLLLQYKLFIILRNLYTRGANEADKTVNVLS